MCRAPSPQLPPQVSPVCVSVLPSVPSCETCPAACHPASDLALHCPKHCALYFSPLQSMDCARAAASEEEEKMRTCACAPRTCRGAGWAHAPFTACPREPTRSTFRVPAAATTSPCAAPADPRRPRGRPVDPWTRCIGRSLPRTSDCLFPPTKQHAQQLCRWISLECRYIFHAPPPPGMHAPGQTLELAAPMYMRRYSEVHMPHSRKNETRTRTDCTGCIVL
jgi:hypothetical protein